MGRILCCSFKPLGGEVYTLRADTPKFRARRLIDDGKLVRAIRDELEQYDLIVGWNSKMFDLPFINARLSKSGERPVRPHFHLDLMYYAGGTSMRIGSRKLINVQKYFGLGEEKTDITWEQWQEAGAGSKDAMDVVVEHCEQDVKVLELAYQHLLPYVANLHR